MVAAQPASSPFLTARIAHHRTHDRAVNFRQEDTSFAAKLSAKERDIYYAAHEATTQFTQWRSGKEKQTATIHATSGKRKRHDA